VFASYQFRLNVCSNYNALKYAISPFICTSSPKNKYYSTIKLALEIRHSSSDRKTKTQKSSCKFTTKSTPSFISVHLPPPVQNYRFSVLSFLNWNIVKFTEYMVVTVMWRTVLQGYIIVTEVGLPAILTRISRVFCQFLLKMSYIYTVSLSFHCFTVHFSIQ